jgi:flagellar motor switch protein FliN/FliY
MTRLTADVVERVAATCQANLVEIAASLSRALDLPITAALARLGAFAPAARPADWAGPGLVVTLTVDDAAVVVVIAEMSGLVPSWTARPDITGQGKLSALAQELGKLALPEDLAPHDVCAGRVSHIDQAIEAAGLSSTAASIALTLTADAKQGTAKIVWPVEKPDAIFAADGQPRAEKASSPGAFAHLPKTPNPSTSAPAAAAHGFPPYLQSLLQIQVPVSVTLVSKRQPLQRILELGPGSILPFDKLCTEELSLDVAGQSIAEGEAVKVGDKFGLRLTSLVLPSERLGAIQRRKEKSGG